MQQFIIFASIADDAKATADKFGLNTPDFIAQVISFSIVALLLYLFAYKPILKVLEERRTRIAESLANADRIKQELEKAEAARQQIMAQANAQANKLIEEARNAAAKVQENETQRAVAAAEQIIAKAREAAAQDHHRMLQELKKEIGQLVVRTTAQVTGKILSLDDQKRLVEEANKQIAA